MLSPTEEPKLAPDGAVIREARESYLADDEPIQILNQDVDISDIGLYHIAMTSAEAREKLSGVKKVIMCGTADRAMHVAMDLHDRLGQPIHDFSKRPSIREGLKKGDLSKVRNWVLNKVRKAIEIPVKITDDKRYSMFLVGDTLVVNHHMGLGTMEILVTEIIMALAAAGASGVTMFRIGTCGGIGEDPGTVVIADKVWSETPDSDLEHEGKKYVPIAVSGENEWWPGDVDPTVGKKLFKIAKKLKLPTAMGGVMSKLRFYSGEARTDGAICDHGHEKATGFFQLMHDLGIRKSEMEAMELVSIAARHGIHHAIICVVLDNCFTHESISFTDAQMKEFASRPIEVVLQLLAEEMGRELKPKEKSWARRILQSLFM